jgi:sugar (pentulose or hexulose) kinase
MNANPVIAVFDIGKTNKKLLLFDKDYKVVFEKSVKLAETQDEDGDPCESLENLRLFIFDSLRDIFSGKQFSIKAINFSAYGASFVYIDEAGNPLTPLYNYLKPFPTKLQKKFCDTYGGEKQIALETASSLSGSLNSGMQLYRIKYEKSEVFEKIKFALHLPQYLSYLLTGVPCSEITSIGCHTTLWDFQKNDYHNWVYQEGLIDKFPPITETSKVFEASSSGSNYYIGTGLHDSSAALIPYLLGFHEPFILISTGTWCISLNPFNSSPLTTEELENDSLCYLTYQGKPVKAARLFSGREHEEHVKKIADHFGNKVEYYNTILFDPEIFNNLKAKEKKSDQKNQAGLKASSFAKRDLTQFSSDKEAYHQLILDLVKQQILSTASVLNGTKIKRVFVDGGFSNNNIYMNCLAALLPEMEIYAAAIPQATALGAVLAIHDQWNKAIMPDDLIQLRYYSSI